TASTDNAAGQALLAGKFCFLSTLNDKWFIDSGATDHMCCDLTLFAEYHVLNVENNYIRIPDGRKVPVKHIGKVILTSEVILDHVLYVPDFHYNLISINKLCKDMSCCLVFTHDTCLLQDPSMKERQIVLGRLHGGLYHFGIDKNSADNKIDAAGLYSTAVTSSLNKAKLWHLRMGHIPFAHLQVLIPDCDVKQSLVDSICQVCPKAKQTRISFVQSHIKTNRPFALLHIDVWGPYVNKTHTDCNQFITIVDDYSRYTWVHLLKHKNGAVTVFKQFYTYVKTQFGVKILAVRSDNAKELTEGELKLFFQSKGIVNQTSCTDTPQQNGVVERKHRHLLEVARALHFQSNLLIRFWGECVLCGTYLINRMPLKSIDMLTPYYKMFQTHPDISNLKVFGCLCFVSTLKTHRSKFQPRATPCVFIGYPPSKKGYKVLNLETNKIFISRDVIFHEHHLPFHFHSSSDSSDSSTIFLPSVTPISFSDSPFPLYSSSQTSSSTQTSHIPTSSSDFSSEPSSVQPIPTDSTVNSPSVRKSSRSHKLPSYLQDYYCNTIHLSPDSGSHWCNLVSTSDSSLFSQSLAATTHITPEPTSYSEAATDPLWEEAMNKEIKALIDN
ncbi:Retrovirus-related Pol polyprotein from transposon RE1, partial [Bienertia sinuspersici]